MGNKTIYTYCYKATTMVFMLTVSMDQGISAQGHDLSLLCVFLEPHKGRLERFGVT